MDLRLGVVRAVEGGSSIREAARSFAVSPSAAIKLMRRVRPTGSAGTGRYGGHRRPVLEPHEADLRRLVEAMPDLTLAELRTELQRRCGVQAGLSTIDNALRAGSACGIKQVLAELAEQERPDVRRQGAGGGGGWQRFDRTRRTSSSSTRPGPPPTWRGATADNPSVRRLIAVVPHGHWRTTTLIAGLEAERHPGAAGAGLVP